MHVISQFESEYERHFRPADDIFEDAARKIEERGGKYNDASFVVNAQDILQFASLTCVKDSLQRVCDIKGECSQIRIQQFLISFDRSYIGDRSIQI